MGRGSSYRALKYGHWLSEAYRKSLGERVTRPYKWYLYGEPHGAVSLYVARMIWLCAARSDPFAQRRWAKTMAARLTL